jgi:acetyl-CoA acetyltransferase
MISIAGIGESDYSRRSGRSIQALAAAAGTAALRDAGLRALDMDGVIALGGSLFTEDVIAALGLPLQVFDASPAPGGNAAVSALRLGMVMIESGRAMTVIIIFARNGSSGERIFQRVAHLPGQQFRRELEQPHGWSSPAQWYAMICRRHMIEYGTTKNQLAAVSLTAHQYAQDNPRAMRFGHQMSESDYHSAPMIADPYQLYDCCLETDGAAAVILAADVRSPERRIDVLAAESARPESPDDLTNRPDWYQIGLSYAAPAAYQHAGLGPQDMDAAMIYDCFTFEVIHQLEVAGFCPRGNGGSFVESGAIGPNGTLPVNTHGGLLAEGHLGGLNHVIEAVRQLRGECGRRQLTGVQRIAVTGWGDWGDGSMAILAAP